MEEIMGSTSRVTAGKFEVLEEIMGSAPRDYSMEV
jgi:hypothetical protein